MCKTERFDIVHDDGRRIPSERLVPCHRGSPTRPCGDVEIVPLFEDRLSTLDSNSRGGPDGSSSYLDVSFEFRNPFRTNKIRKPGLETHPVRERTGPRDDRIIYPQRCATPPPPNPPISQPRPHSHEREPKQESREDQSNSAVSQLPYPSQTDHNPRRRTRSASPGSKYEVEKKLIWDRERRMYADRVGRQEQEAPRRAARVAEFERLERLERNRKGQEMFNYEERRRIESSERIRRRQQQEEFGRAQAIRRQELEDISRLNTAERALRRQEEFDRRRREQDEKYRSEEVQRLQRVCEVNIPRRPRYQHAVHYERESIEDRGERFIREAITQEKLRQFERLASPIAPEQRQWQGGDRVPTPPHTSLLDPVSQAHEPYSINEHKPGDDLASLLSFKSFADSGYESQSLHDVDTELQDGVEELISLLLNDPELQILFTEAFRREKARERFVSKFRMLLKIYGSDLQEEANNASHEAAAGLVQNNATYVATHIKKAYELGNMDTEDETRSANLEAFLQRRYDPSSDSDTAAEEQYEGAKLPPISLEGLKAFMTTSKAFTNLRKAFRRMVYPDSLAAIADIIFREYDSQQPHTVSSATFHIHWNVDEFIMNELGYDPKLHERERLLESVLVVAGSASKAYATTAIKYMHWRWPQSDCEILRIIHSRIRKIPINQDPATPAKPNIKILSQETAEASFLVTGSVEQIIEVAQQLAWITATFRVPLYGQVSYSEVLVSRTGDTIFDLSLPPLEEIRERVGACWLPLFINGIVARGFPIPVRNQELGIEIPFTLMTALANVMYPVFHTKGVYLRGFSNLLFPTKVSSDMESIQWHLKTSTRARTHLPHGTLPDATDDNEWVKFDDLERLASAPRTFLGCYRQVHVNLGTRALAENSHKITYSNADDEKPAAGMTQKSVTTGFSGMGIWSTQLNMEFVLPKGLITTLEPGWYHDMLDLAKDTPLMVYDNARSERRAWLVPQLGVILHMAHVWACNKTDLLRPIPSAASHWDSGEAALSVITRHSKDELRDALEDDKQYCLRDLIGRLLTSIHKLAEVEAAATREPGRTVKFGSSKLYGWELLDVVRGKKSILRKQVNVTEDWTILGQETVVLFCQNFGDIIEPAPHVRLCPMAKAIYQGENRLIATIKCLQRLSEERSGKKDDACLKIAKGAYWLCSSINLFDDCTHGVQSGSVKEARCEKRPQQILRDYVDPKSCETPPIEGAVTFGTKRLKKQRAPLWIPTHFKDHSAEHSNGTAIGLDGSSVSLAATKSHDINGANLPKTVNNGNRNGSPFWRIASKFAVKYERKQETGPYPSLGLHFQPNTEPTVDPQGEDISEAGPRRIKHASVSRSSCHRPIMDLPTHDCHEGSEQYSLGEANAPLQLRYPPLPGPSSHSMEDERRHHTHEILSEGNPRTGSANVTQYSLHQPVLPLAAQEMEETSAQDMQELIKADIKAENLEEFERRGRPENLKINELSKMMPPQRTRSEHRLRRCSRRSNLLDGI